MLLSFEDYQIKHGQLFEARAAFNAALEMCKAHYEGEPEKEEPKKEAPAPEASEPEESGEEE
jgi:hypothetical protein